MLTRSDIDRVVSAALAEDAPWGDATAEAFVPASVHARAELVAREAAQLRQISYKMCDAIE